MWRPGITSKPGKLQRPTRVTVCSHSQRDAAAIHNSDDRPKRKVARIKHFAASSLATCNSLSRKILQHRKCKIPYPPPPPYFAMCVLIKDLQRSVVDVYANKGLRKSARATFRSPRVFLSPHLGPSSRDEPIRFVDSKNIRRRILTPGSRLGLLRASALTAFSCFFYPQKVHYNALFRLSAAKTAL
jgi:hypothetical protein